jgi:hypothetical protein
MVQAIRRRKRGRGLSVRGRFSTFSGDPVGMGQQSAVVFLSVNIRGWTVNNAIAAHLDQLLAQRDDNGVTIAKRIALEIVAAALKGDAFAARIIMDSQATFDPILDALTEDEDVQP